jgi:hypothetical protein
MRMIGDIVFGTTSKDPVEISEIMMNHPKLPMLGVSMPTLLQGPFWLRLKITIQVRLQMKISRKLSDG